MNDVTVLGDALLVKMMRSAQHLAAFPFLKEALRQAQVSGVTSCGSCRAEKFGINFNQLKAQFASLDAASLTHLKNLLNTRSVKIKYRNSPNDLMSVLR